MIKFVNKSLLVRALLLVLMISLGVGLKSANASEFNYSKKNSFYPYLQYTHYKLIPTVGRGDAVNYGIGAPTTNMGYHLYLNGSRSIWSQPGHYLNNRYIPSGVKITSRIGSMQLALHRLPFKAFRDKNNGASLEIKPRNNKYIGWIDQAGMYSYTGNEGVLSIRYSKEYKIKHNRKVLPSKSTKRAYHIGASAYNCFYDKKSSELAAHHNPFFKQGFYRTAFNNYMNSSYTPMYNYYNQNTGQVNQNFSKDPRIRHQVNKDIRFGLLALTKYYHKNYAFKQGFKMAQGDDNIPLIHNKSFKQGFNYGIKFVFGKNINRKAEQSYYNNVGAIDRDM